MKSILTVLSVTLMSLAAHTAQLECKTDAPSQFSPRFVLKAEVADPYQSGLPLEVLLNVRVTVANKLEENLGDLLKDRNYKPRMDNRVRFATKDLDASEDNEENYFDGIIHGVILPEVNSGTSFQARVISSTDSYHDGINTYFPMNCTLK